MDNVDQFTWVDIQEYMHHRSLSLSTARRLIKSNKVLYKKENGKYFINQETEFDLFVPLIKKSGWVNIYPQSLSDSPIRTSRVYLTEKDALENKDLGCIDTIKIHWEE